MKEDVADKIAQAIDEIKFEEPKSRGAALAITKLEEALFWLREARKEQSSSSAERVS